MKRRFSLALLCALSACSQAANVEIYGQIDQYLAINKNSGDYSVRLMNAGATASHFGLRGSETLSGSTRLIFNMDAAFQADTGAIGGTDGTGLFNRQCWVGLTNPDFGTLTAGKIYPPYSIAIYLLDVTDFSLGSGYSPYFYPYPGGVNGDVTDSLGRLNNALSWVSPEMAGWTIWAFAALGEQGQSSTKGNVINLAASYRNGPLFAMFSFLDQEESASASGNIRNAGYMLDGTYEGYVRGSKVPDVLSRSHHSQYYLAGLTYDLGWTKPSLMLVVRKGDDTVQLPDFAMVQVGAATPVMGGRLSASVAGYRNFSASRADSLGWGLRYDYPVSKRTKIYGGVTGVFNERNAKYSIEAGPDSSLHFSNRYGVNQNQIFIGASHSF